MRRISRTYDRPGYLDRPASLRTQSATPTSQRPPSSSSPSPSEFDQRIGVGVHALIQPFPIVRLARRTQQFQPDLSDANYRGTRFKVWLTNALAGIDYPPTFGPTEMNLGHRTEVYLILLSIGNLAIKRTYM